MADEPGGWELKRSHEQLRQDMRDGFNQLGQRLDKVVTAEAFAAEQRRVDDKHRDLADDIASERAQRIAAIAEEQKAREKGDQRQQDALDRLIANQKWIVVAILIPIALFVANLLIRSGS